MFFILILLIIAFATILRVERYSFKKLLPKLILMAVLINFSKLICGIFIDFTQVIMLTFVNGFKDIGTGNLTNMLGIDKIMSMDSTNTESGGGAVTAWSIVGAYMLALMYSVIALIVIVTMVAVLAMRMIMIWVYVVLSPLAYLLSAFPAGEKYASQWWEEFSKNLIVGPVLAFFIWLSFVSLGGVETPSVVGKIAQNGKSLSEADRTNITGDISAQASSTGPSAGITEAGSPDHMIKFIISIAMLVGGLQISQQMGGQAGGMAGKGMAKMQKLGSGAMKSIGTGLKRATGVERVQMAYKSYKDTKASERSSRAKDDALNASRVIGNAKQNLVAKPYQNIKKSITERSSRKAEREKVQVAAKTQELQNIKAAKVKPFNDRIDTLAQSKSRIEQEREAINTTGKDLNGNVVRDKIMALDQLDKRESGLKQQAIAGGLDYNKLGDNNYVKTEKEKFVDSHENDADLVAKRKEINVHKNRAHKYEEQQAKRDNFKNTTAGKIIGAVPKVASMILTPGHFAMEKMRGKQATSAHLSNWGKKDLNLAANYNASKISTKKDELKYANKDKIMDTIKNTTDHHEHAAATAIAMEKNLFASSAAAKIEKDKVHDRFQKDDRVSSVMDTAAEKHFLELSKPYSTLRDPNAPEQKKQEAHAQIAAGFENGSNKISDMSNEALGTAIQGIVDGLKDKNFQKQYDGASDSQQKTLKLKLEEQIQRSESAGNNEVDDTKKKAHYERAYNAKKKLAYTEGFNMDRFGDSDANGNEDQKRNHQHKTDFLASMNDSEAIKSVTNKNSGKHALQEIKVRLDSNNVKINQNSTVEEIAQHLAKILPNAGLERLGSTSKEISNTVKSYITGSNPTTPPVNPVV